MFISEYAEAVGHLQANEKWRWQDLYDLGRTIANTVREKSDRLYFIIDEAHRGMQGREASKATTIMQKFIKGSDSDGIPPMPVVIGYVRHYTEIQCAG